MYTRKQARFDNKIQRLGYSQKRHGSSEAELKVLRLWIGEWQPL